MKETKTMQVYPDDAVVNDTAKTQGMFGWELISNQRCQEFTSQDSDGTKHYETFNKLTFTREQNAPWYDRVAELESEYWALAEERKKVERQMNLPTAPHFSFGTFCWGLLFFGLPGVIYLIHYLATKKKKRKEWEKKNAYIQNELEPERERILSRAEEIIQEARSLIRGR